jgi:hypothetical protein
VANLSRNITVRGENAPGSTFGAHTMYMAGSTVRMNSVEITGMGQLGKLGRYPWHTHLMGDTGKGSYLKNSAVHSNFQRGVVIHRTNDVVVQNNTIYNTIGHLVFLESSNEVRNTFDANLVMLTRPVPLDKMNPELGFEFMPDFMTAHSRVSGFWISNQHNRFTRNHVVGILSGHGYWFVEGSAMCDTRDRDLWDCQIPADTSKTPYAGPLLAFDNNVAHTLRPSAQHGGSNGMRPSGNAVMLDKLRVVGDQVPVIKNQKVWKVSMHGVWGIANFPATPIVENLVTADTKSAIFNGDASGPMAVRGSVFYAMTDNQPPGVDKLTRNFYALWNAFGHHPDDLTVQPVATYPDDFGLQPIDGVIPEPVMLGLGSVNKRQRFSEFRNVTLGGGWPQP